MAIGSPVTTEGWEAPVFHAMTQTPTYRGVPMAFFAGNFLVSLFITFTVWWPAILVGLLLYGIAYVGTWYEPDWLGILGDYCSYTTHYEG